MRWSWIDRFEAFVSGKSCIAVKAVSTNDEPVDEYLLSYPHYPASLIIEGVAQAGGVLVAQIEDFQHRVVLAKINRSEFHRLALPGDRLRFEVEINHLQESGAVVSGKVTCDDQLQAEVELVFAYLGAEFDGVVLFEPAEFCKYMRNWKLFDVGVNQDGSSIQIPSHMVAAEQAMLVAHQRTREEQSI